MQILIIEDNKKLAENIADVLRHEHYQVTIAFTGQEGQELALTHPYDLILLDLALPDIDGQQICHVLRKEGVKTSLLMLTARIDLESKVEGLDGGADDYLTKPFLMDELLARIRALTRRTSINKSSCITVGELSIDLAKRIIKRKKQMLKLSPIEFSIVEFLLMKRGKPQTSIDIYESVWGSHNDDIVFSDTLKVHVARLRKKIGSEVIKTIPGQGYMIEE